MKLIEEAGESEWGEWGRMEGGGLLLPDHRLDTFLSILGHESLKKAKTAANDGSGGG